MALVDMRDMLNHAYDNGYAVGAFGLANFEFIEGIMQAAENSRAPVILNLSSGHARGVDLSLVLPAAEAAAKRASVPVAIHYDHAADLNEAVSAVNQGSIGVMVETSNLPLDQNIIATSEVVAMARGCGVAAEGDLGYVAGEEGEDGDSTLTTPAEAKAFAERTGLDFLAVSVGNRHGRVKGRLRLDFTRLKQIDAAVNKPLVIHGGSGLTEDQYRRLVGCGVTKINYYTALSDLAAQSISKNARADSKADYAALKKDVKELISQEVEHNMRVWGSAGRAAEVLSRCKPWTPVEHVIIYNVENSDGSSVAAMIEEGRRVLAAIPGVREVFTGEAVREDSRYRFCWLVRFAHPAVIDSYRYHPAHVRFANNSFRPVAGDRISIDYGEVRSDVGELDTGRGRNIAAMS